MLFASGTFLPYRLGKELPMPTTIARTAADVARAILVRARDQIDGGTSTGREARAITRRGICAVGDWQVGACSIAYAIATLETLAARPATFDAGATPSLAIATGACSVAAMVLSLANASPAAEAVAYVRANA
jgi:hypothetical protein